MAYKKSEPARRWRTDRSEAIAALARGHASVGEVTGPGRPLDVSKPLAHAYIIVMLREFQGFVRDLHDLATERFVTAAGGDPRYWPILIEGLTKGRAIDRGNATHDAIKSDFGRLGLTSIDISTHNKRWTKPSGTDSKTFNALVELRNALGHGNETKLRKLVLSGDVKDSVSWARGRLPVLNRYASALDHVVWDYLVRTTGTEPWS